jgi:hypothetical protein
VRHRGDFLNRRDKMTDGLGDRKSEHIAEESDRLLEMGTVKPV